MTTYCVGFTFWAAMRVLQSNGIIDDKNVNDIRTFRNQFYGNLDDNDKKLCAKAIPDLGDGVEITDKDQWREGNFVQFWRTNQNDESKYGHSVIFVNWETDDNTSGKIGITYYSSQTATNGIGKNTEYFVDYYNGKVIFNEMYAGRIDFSDPLE